METESSDAAVLRVSPSAVVVNDGTGGAEAGCMVVNDGTGEAEAGWGSSEGTAGAAESCTSEVTLVTLAAGCSASSSLLSLRCSGILTTTS